MTVNVPMPPDNEQAESVLPMRWSSYSQLASDRPHDHIRSYADAAFLLLRAAETDVVSEDKLYTPIVFLFRHYVELTLRNFIIVSARILGKSVGQNHLRIIGRHSLQQLWSNLEPMLEDVARSGARPLDIAGLDFLAEQIRILGAYDADMKALEAIASQLAYPTARQTEPSKLHIHLASLKDTMDRVTTSLADIAVWLTPRTVQATAR